MNLQTQLDAKTSENREQKKEFETSQQTITSLRVEIQSINTQLSESKTREDALTKKCDQLAQDKDNLCKEKETLDKQYAEKESDIRSKGNKDLQEQLDKNTILNTQKNELEQQLNVLSEQVSR